MLANLNIEIEGVLKIEFEKLKQDLLNAYNSKGMVASGNWGNSLKNTTSGTVGTLRAAQYTEQLQDGRKPGSFPPVDQIRAWVVQKGLVSASAKQSKINSVAYLVSRKIAKEGWKRKDHGGVNLVSDVITPERVQEIIDKVGITSTIAITTELTNQLKQIN